MHWMFKDKYILFDTRLLYVWPYVHMYRHFNAISCNERSARRAKHIYSVRVTEYWYMLWKSTFSLYHSFALRAAIKANGNPRRSAAIRRYVLYFFAYSQLIQLATLPDSSAWFFRLLSCDVKCLNFEARITKIQVRTLVGLTCRIDKP